MKGKSFADMRALAGEACGSQTGVCAAVALVLALAGPAQAARPDPADARYALAGGCYAMRSVPHGGLVAKSGNGYRASAGEVGQAEPFRMQATALGSYLFYGPKREFLAVGSQGRIEPATRASDAADWEVEVDQGAFTVFSPAAGKALSVSGDGELVLGEAARFAFVPATGCADYPEIELNAVGKPFTGTPRYGEVSGLIDAHLHMMAFEFLGGRAHCGRPWHRFGVTHAMVDCPDHEPGGAGAALENVVSPNAPGPTHDTTGWPTFRDWPHHGSLTHEQTYYRGLERAWMGGLRLVVNLLVENAALCEAYPYKHNDCNEMESARLQARRIYELEDYIDAQHGGPGKGWFRIVRDPFEARRVINGGKLAVVLGIEVSSLFDCGVYNGVPQCDRAQIDRQLDEFYDLGVRDLELVNKFDNALAGVAGDAGNTGVVVNTGNKYKTGHFWHMERCTGPDHDKPQHAAPEPARDGLFAGGLAAFLPAGATPVYSPPPHCNARGLTPLGEYLVNRMIEKRMIIDPDHLSVAARDQLLALAEAKDYSGVVSSHSWSTPSSYPRIAALGGVVTPITMDSTDFVEEWKTLRPILRLGGLSGVLGRRGSRPSTLHYSGFGYGADSNGFHEQPGPRGGGDPGRAVTYPFKSFDGGVTFERQRAGERVYDVNKDGVAQYGLHPDWIEELRLVAGDQIVTDMFRGAEAYLQMWERAVGIPQVSCRFARGRLTHRGLSWMRLGYGQARLLRRAGQPLERSRAWTYCVRGRKNLNAKVVTALTRAGRVGLVASTGRGHEALGIAPGAPASRLPGRARPLAADLWVRSAGPRGARFVYGVDEGRVSYVGVASRSVAKSVKTLRRYVRLARLR